MYGVGKSCIQHSCTAAFWVSGRCSSDECISFHGTAHWCNNSCMSCMDKTVNNFDVATLSSNPTAAYHRHWQHAWYQAHTSWRLAHIMLLVACLWYYAELPCRTPLAAVTATCPGSECAPFVVVRWSQPLLLDDGGGDVSYAQNRDKSFHILSFARMYKLFAKTYV